MKPVEGKRFPIGGMFELNERCNLSCVHCFINQAINNWASQETELTTQHVYNILDEIAEAGCLFLTFTGGEPLIRPDFGEIYLYARKKGMIVTVFTNGTTITKQIADLLASSPPQLVEITLYGATRETYEKVTGVKGSYDRCMRGIHLLLDRGIRVGLKAVVLTINRDELPAMRNFAEDMGMNFRYDGTVWPRLDGDESAYQFRLSVAEMLELDQENPQRIEAWEERAQAFSNVLVRNEYVFSCGAGLRTFLIDSKGFLNACIMVRNPSYDLKKVRFLEAWEKLGELRTWERQKRTVCENCSVGALCSQCPGWSLIVHGDYETPVDYVCQLGKSRAGQLITN